MVVFGSIPLLNKDKWQNYRFPTYETVNKSLCIILTLQRLEREHLKNQ